ncbi:hypothetical protein Taro_017879 [Colocasia esculenta]|uniref:Protein LOW PSII ACCUMULATION 1, chloroplastic n=1 Tax=Colocasia esculenta TaxID=4460 RepID=A0A843UPE9_COLES|nr:hypothetical protein [Colocasia esculenta]
MPRTTTESDLNARQLQPSDHSETEVTVTRTTRSHESRGGEGGERGVRVGLVALRNWGGIRRRKKRARKLCCGGSPLLRVLSPMAATSCSIPAPPVGVRFQNAIGPCGIRFSSSSPPPSVLHGTCCVRLLSGTARRRRRREEAASIRCSAANKPSSSEISSTAKIRSEVLSPFRSVRMFFYLAFIASGGLGGLIALTRLIGALANSSRAAEIPEIFKGLGVDVGAVLIFAFLYSRESSAKNAQVARLSREENLSNLKLRVDEKKVIPVSSLRGIARLVILAGPASFISESFKRSLSFTEALLDRGVLVVPFVTDGNTPVMDFEENEKDMPLLQRKKRLWQLTPVYASEWSKWLDEQKEMAKVALDAPVTEPRKSCRIVFSHGFEKEVPDCRHLGSIGIHGSLKRKYPTADIWARLESMALFFILEGCCPPNLRLDPFTDFENQAPEVLPYLSLRMDGRVRGSGIGYPPWNAFVAQLPPVKGIWTGLLDGMDGRVL